MPLFVFLYGLCFKVYFVWYELPRWLKWQRICLHCGRLGFDPWVTGRSTGVGNGNPLQYLCLEFQGGRHDWALTYSSLVISVCLKYLFLSPHFQCVYIFHLEINALEEVFFRFFFFFSLINHSLSFDRSIQSTNV